MSNPGRDIGLNHFEACKGRGHESNSELTAKPGFLTANGREWTRTTIQMFKVECLSTGPTARNSLAQPIGLGYGDDESAPQRGALQSRPFRPQVCVRKTPGRWPGLRNHGPLARSESIGFYSRTFASIRGKKIPVIAAICSWAVNFELDSLPRPLQGLIEFAQLA